MSEPDDPPAWRFAVFAAAALGVFAAVLSAWDCAAAAFGMAIIWAWEWRRSGRQS